MNVSVKAWIECIEDVATTLGVDNRNRQAS